MSINLVMILIFIVFILVSYLVEELSPPSCLKGEIVNNRQNRSAIEQIYLIFLSVLSIILAIVVVVLGIYFILILKKKISDKNRYIIRLTYGAILVFPILFTIRSILLLLTVVYRYIVVNPIIYSIIEGIPTIVLIIYIMPGNINICGYHKMTSTGSINETDKTKSNTQNKSTTVSVSNSVDS